MEKIIGILKPTGKIRKSFSAQVLNQEPSYALTLESGIDVGQGITVWPGKFVKKNKRRALNKRRA